MSKAYGGSFGDISTAGLPSGEELKKQQEDARAAEDERRQKFSDEQRKRTAELGRKDFVDLVKSKTITREQADFLASNQEFTIQMSSIGRRKGGSSAGRNFISMYGDNPIGSGINYALDPRTGRDLSLISLQVVNGLEGWMNLEK